ncbi:MAG: C40 family peptidase [Bacteroidota bacterium]|mgnify:CR=1 FL=1
MFGQVAAENSEPIAEARINNTSEIQLRDEIVGYAQKHLGTKYRPAGKTPGAFDCSGFVYHVMKEFEFRMASCSGLQERQGKKITREEAQPGDLVFFRRSKKTRVFHVAMVLSNEDGNLTLIHSTSSRGVVIDKLKESAYWRSKIMTVRNVLGGE